jgi:hypothetical protein
MFVEESRLATAIRCLSLVFISFQSSLEENWAEILHTAPLLLDDGGDAVVLRLKVTDAWK